MTAYCYGCVTTAHHFPKAVDPSKKYLFYLHGKIIEDKGVHARHPRYGAYDYSGILSGFEKHGYHIISEMRPSGTDPERYADFVADHVRKLSAAGVPPENIAVAGFSKGGVIALHSAAVQKNPDIHYIIMASCGKDSFSRSFERIKGISPSLQGKFLSLYDASETEGGSCRAAFELSGSGITYEEIVLNTTLGHGLF